MTRICVVKARREGLFFGTLELKNEIARMKEAFPTRKVFLWVLEWEFLGLVEWFYWKETMVKMDQDRVNISENGSKKVK